MANPFSPTTTGGIAGQIVYQELEKNQKRQTDSIAGSRAAKYEAEDQTRVNNYVVVLRALDQDALDKISTINSKKQQIITIINNAVAARTTSDDYLSTKSAALADATASKVVFTVGISTFEYDCTTTPGDPPIQECQVGVRGPVYPDILTAWYYPNVENLDASAIFYKGGETYTKVTSSNLGIGVTAYIVGVANTTTAPTGLVSESASLGTYYYFNNIDGVIAGAAASISTLVSEIETLRGEVTTYLTGISTGTNKVRALKSAAQVDLWFEKKGQETTNLPDYQGGKSTMEDNTSIIQNYNS